MANIEPLRPFQEEDVPWFLQHLKSMMLYEPRLGKTVVSCQVLAKDPLTTSVLVACSKNAVSVWIDHIATWFKHLIPDKPIDFRVISGKGSNAALQRQEEWKRPRKPGHITIYLVTFKALLNDWPWLQSQKLTTYDTIIGDEVHKVLRSRKTLTTKVFQWLVKNCRRFHALSGTLAGKWGPADYYNLLNIINPYEFSSYWRFVGTWCIVIDGYWGKEILGPKNRDNFHLMMSRFARFRDRKTYGPQMPKVVRDLYHVKMSPKIRALYDGIGRDSFTFTDAGNIIIARNSLEKHMRKRQLLTCPAIVDPTLGVGAPMEEILDILADAKELENELDQHIVIFSALRASLQHFEGALRAAGYANVYTLAGGTEPEDLVRITQDFRRTKGIMLCTTQFAQAFSLDSSRVCYHIGWSWDPNENKQAEDRLVAQSGDYFINSYYFAHDNSDDDNLAVAVTQKNMNIYLTNTNPKLQPEKVAGAMFQGGETKGQ